MTHMLLRILYPGCQKVCLRINKLEIQLTNSVTFPFPKAGWLFQSPLSIYFYLNIEDSPSSHQSVMSTTLRSCLTRKYVRFNVCSSFGEELLIRLFSCGLFPCPVSVCKEISIIVLQTRMNRCGFQGNSVHTAVIEISLDCQSLKGIFMPLSIPLQIDSPRAFKVCVWSWIAQGREARTYGDSSH